MLEKAGSFFDAARSDAGLHASDFSMPRSESATASAPLLGGLESGEPATGAAKTVRLGFITGVVPSERTEAFERVLFRATRGNMFLKQAPIEGKVEDPATGDKVHKTVYVVFFAGERARAKIL